MYHDREGMIHEIIAREILDSRGNPTIEVDVGLEVIEVDLPAVVTTDLRLNEPRYVKLPDIMKAKKKPLDQLPIADLGIEFATPIKSLAFEPPAERVNAAASGQASSRASAAAAMVRRFIGRPPAGREAP